MKKLFRLNEKRRASESRLSDVPRGVTNSFHVGLEPKYIVPPVPRPGPYQRIAILATRSGLLLRPAIPANARPDTHVRISWGNTLEVQEVQGDGESDGADWSQAAIVFGVLGTVKLYSGMLSASLIRAVIIEYTSCSGAYVLVITAKTDVGSCTSQSNRNAVDQRFEPSSRSP